MEALSPRDVNTHIRMNHAVKQVKKPEVAQSKINNKEKDHPPPPPPKVVEPASSSQKDGIIYKTGQFLGRGGFAICYEGQQTETKLKYALKIVKTHMPQKKMEQKFKTELQIHSKMKHPNIVEFHKAFSYQKCTYIVLELCPNGSLMDLVKKRKFITEPEVRFWTVQIVGAIKYMHGKGIIHRDLKMGNIFLDKKMNVKIGDFGLAALLMSGKDWQACRRTTQCGTPNYIAPEILSKDKSGHDQSVDIWSLGIIIFAMLTGKPPFQSATSDEIYRKARERDYYWPTVDKSENFISEETKNLVSELFQTAQQRPDPDSIVQRPFFTCGWTPKPEEMANSSSERYLDQFPLPTSDREDITILSLKNLKRLCVQCEVGPWTPARKHTSAYREVEEEEKLGLTPAMPLAEDVIYRPYHNLLRERMGDLRKNGQNTLEALKIFKEIVPPTSKLQIKQVPPVRSSIRSLDIQQQFQSQKSNYLQPARVDEPHRASSIKDQSSDRKNAGLSVARESMQDAKGRLVIDMFDQLNISTERGKSKEYKLPQNAVRTSPSIFDSTDKVQILPNTKPNTVLSRLHCLQAELERSLRSRSTAIDCPIPQRSPVIVVKWVDYTNKFGLGYILSDGSVGTLFKAIPAFPHSQKKDLSYPTSILVKDSEKHLVNQNNPNWSDYGELVPLAGPKIEFFENRGNQGIFRGECDATRFKSVPGPNGEMFKLGIGRDEFDSRKKERVAIWRKFGNYMTQYGRDSDYPRDKNYDSHLEAESPTSNVVTFYQRWGDVGCWGFDDGHLQFNFPDHTKIILSADGKWCDFYHLPLEAARDLAEKGLLSPQALDDRQHLSYPLQKMLNFAPRSSRSRSYRQPGIDPMILHIPEANDLRRKIEFIVLCIKEWTTNGGIGISDLSVHGRLRWSGVRQTIGNKIPYKQVWVCIGGHGSDERKVMWFDPRSPDIISPDI